MSEEPQHAGSEPAPRSAALPWPAARTTVATDVALVATGAAFVAVCAMGAVTLPGMAVPITLQTLGVLLVGAVLGPRRAALALLLYLAVGLAGLPVFAGFKGGLGVLGGASAGYLLSFPAAAALVGWLVRRVWRVRPALRAPMVFVCCLVTTLTVVHPLGIAVMGARLGLSATEAVVAGAAFLPGDVVKNAVVAIVATAVLRAFPDLLGARRP